MKTATSSFQQFHKQVYATLWINLTESMNGIGHDFKFDHFNLFFFCRVLDHLFESFIHAIDQNLSAIFWTPNNMIFANRYDVPITFEFLFRTHILIIQICAVSCNPELSTLRADPPYIPTSEGSGFTAVSGKHANQT